MLANLPELNMRVQNHNISTVRSCTLVKGLPQLRHQLPRQTPRHRLHPHHLRHERRLRDRKVLPKVFVHRLAFEHCDLLGGMRIEHGADDRPESTEGDADVEQADLLR